MTGEIPSKIQLFLDLNKVFKLLKKYEQNVFDLFTYQTIISKPDRENINHANKSNIKIIPNGVDHDKHQNYLDVQKDYDVVFTGNMQYPPNVDAAIYLAQEIMPLIWEEKKQKTLGNF